MVFLCLLIFPVLVALGFFIFGKHTVTWKEFLAHLTAQCIVAGISIGVIYHSNTHDVEVWNGRISAKKRVRVSCGHSYSCNCVTSCTGGKTSTCTTICQTCYEHSYDVDWRVYTDIGERFNISRVNRQGTHEPPRWTAVNIGEPYSSTHSFTNYIKASPGTLFRKQGLLDKYKGKLPKYPQRIYDYHRLDRIVDMAGLNVKSWNKDLSEVNADMGPKKQANIILVFTKDQPLDFFHALEQHWLGGKKNDIIIVLDTDGKDVIQWVRVMAWAQNKLFQVKLRDELQDIKKIDKENIFSTIRKVVSSDFKRKPMKDFKYLKSNITPSKTQWIVSMVLGLLVSIGLGIFFVKNDITERRF